MKKMMYKVSCSLLLILSAAWQLQAQTRITGRVEDNTGPLQGATIKIIGTSYVGTTDYDGQFSMALDVKGKQQLTIHYLGFQELLLPLELAEKGTLNLGVLKLTASTGQQLEGVLVTGAYRPSQVRALQMKKSSANLVETLAADAIGKLPDRNAAEAVQRIQGVSIERDLGEGRSVSVRGTPIQWSSSTLNGNRLPSASGDNVNRGLQMDIFPSEIIQFVKMAKALTPDMDGDAIGGSIDFITRAATARETFSATVSGGYVDQSQKLSYNGSFVYGNKLSDKLSFMATGVLWDRSSAADNYVTIFDFNNPDRKQSFAMDQFQLRDYVARRRTMGYTGAMEYKINESNTIAVKGLYSQYLDQQTVRESYFSFKQKNVSLQARHADYLTDMYNLQVLGHSKFGQQWNLDWSMHTARSSFTFNSPKNLKKDARGYPIINFMQPMEYSHLAPDGKRYQKVDWPEGDLSNETILPHPASKVDPSKLRLNQIILAQNRNSEVDYAAKFDLGYKVSDKLQLKAGFKGLNKEKDVRAGVLVWMPKSNLGVADSKTTFLQALQKEPFPANGGFLSELGNPYANVLIDQVKNTQIDAFYTEEGIKNYQLQQVQGANAASNIAGIYQGKENVYAGYIMANWQVSDAFLVLAGIRNEYNHVRFQGKKAVTEKDKVSQEDVESIHRYHVPLPMLHAKWNINEQAVLRGSLTRSFARPDFNSLNPGIIINELTNTITEGNTALKPTLSNNADLMFEYYLSDVGLISAGTFYKQLSNIIYDNQSIVSLNNKTYIKNTPENLDKASLLGFELGLSKRFTELPSFLSKLGVELNYSFVDSKIDLPQFEKGKQVSVLTTTLPKQAKHIFNSILFYEDGKVMARIAGNYKGNYLNVIRSQAGADHYQWFDKNFTLDFSASYAVTAKARLFMELNNITNEPNRFYHGMRERMETISYVSFRGQLGVSFQIK